MPGTELSPNPHLLGEWIKAWKWGPVWLGVYYILTEFEIWILYEISWFLDVGGKYKKLKTLCWPEMGHVSVSHCSTLYVPAVATSFSVEWSRTQINKKPASILWLMKHHCPLVFHYCSNFTYEEIKAPEGIKWTGELRGGGGFERQGSSGVRAGLLVRYSGTREEEPLLESVLLFFLSQNQGLGRCFSRHRLWPRIQSQPHAGSVSLPFRAEGTISVDVS